MYQTLRLRVVNEIKNNKMKQGEIHDYLTGSKYKLIRHIGYFLAAIPMLIVWLCILFFTILVSVYWLTVEKGSFRLTWNEFSKFTKDYWTLKL